MPRLSVLMVRAALLWQALGVTLGGLMLAAKVAPMPAWVWLARGSHVHTLLVGWLVQLACGVAFWILPRLDAAGDRGDERPARLAAAALNLGVALAVVGGFVALPWAELAAGALYAVGGLAFVAHAWRRVIPFAVKG
jgi:hypothetical protein